MPVYVQHEVLGKVPDVFNAEALWQAPGLALFARRPLLRDLLERSPREHRGRAATRCFSHVTLMLPQDEVDDDRHLTRGARVRDLAQSLAQLHQKDFGDLLGSDEVRYDVVGADSLEPGQVEVKFGHAVYLPAPDEKVLYAVTTSRDSAIWKPVCSIYPNQRLALIGADDQSASHAAPDWPFGADGAILLINDGPDAPIEVQVRPKGAFDCTFDPIGGYFTVKSKLDGPGARLLMKVTRVAPAAAAPDKPAAASPIQLKPAAVWKTRSRAPDEVELTAVPGSHRPSTPVEGDATYAPVSQQRVSLVALAMPRLSRYRETGALALEIGLDRTLGVAAHAEDAIISFAVDAGDELHAITGAGRERIAVPATFTPVEGGTVTLSAVAPEMADRYSAILTLANPPAVPAASGARFVFGRSAPMLAALRVLDQARFLRRSEGFDSASADRIGLSRNAFSFEAAGGGYQIGRLSATQALYHLDEQMRFVAGIGGDTPYLLPAGHHLVAGHYVLRFDA
ncbi:hypothetical protein Q4S45_07450 [Massilia sp. R2A-15]|uniref:hypothetical protein n=1 Tax=Massilia sp. R2A-15 TaxID=3064278 RepID=UPI002736B90E|nr:hypothetical protein [Massilia sp. R2A-15]WLI90943.1 hypothetical protein Q4S45_07450 [Massilia sp. R2A-15]